MDIFRVPEEEVTKDMRRQAKAVNFGILYGISSYGLSEDLKIPPYEAKAFIDRYFETYPGIKDYMNESIKKAHEDGFVKTIMNRKRVIDELHNTNYMVRSMGERMALNTPIQGSSADILKKSMIEIQKEFENRNLKSTMLLQVHDELIFNVYPDEKEVVSELVVRLMDSVYQLEVPLEVSQDFGNNWYEAK
jgi:DNA polymerase-1